LEKKSKQKKPNLLLFFIILGRNARRTPVPLEKKSKQKKLELLLY